MAVALSALGGAPPPAHAARGAPIFFTACTLSHRSSDDPIVHRNMPGQAHSHDFTGAWSTDAFSTLWTLRASGTTCDIPGDTAAYWTPTLYDTLGAPVQGTTFAYYMAEGKDRERIRPHPAGLKLVADMSADRRSGWHCGDAKRPEAGGTLSRTRIPTCPGGSAGSLQAKVVFPDCWDGRRLDSPDHRSHMAYANSEHRCPRSHPVPVPLLNLKTKYRGSMGGPGLRISSGDAATFHADFFNAWNQRKLKRLTRFCINSTGFDHNPPCRGEGVRTNNPSFPRPTAPAMTPPSVIRFRATRTRFAVARGGTRLRFVLTQPGRVRIRIDRVVRRGRSTRLRRVRLLKSRRLRSRGVIRFRGRVRGRPLRPGRYRASIMARDRAGNRGAAKSLRLRIVR